VAAEHQEGDLHALLILEDEDEDHDEGHQADDDRGPRAAEARLPLTWKGPAIFLYACRSWIVHDADMSCNARRGTVAVMRRRKRKEIGAAPTAKPQSSDQAPGEEVVQVNDRYKSDAPAPDMTQEEQAQHQTGG
jgi:hypothetical protein